MRDYYEVLGVSPDARGDEIRRACRQLVSRYHPDISGDDAVGACCDPVEVPGARGGSGRCHQDTSVCAVPLSVAPDEAWYANEVAIDFPAVDGLLDRMRMAFFGPLTAPSALSAEIVLTPREAFEGAVIPLRVPVRAVCDVCGGRGEIWCEPCHGCGGDGDAVVPLDVRFEVPAGVRPGTVIRFGVTPRSAPTILVEARIAVT